MTDACGFTPGASGSSDASFTYTFRAPWTWPKLSAAQRRVFSPIGTVEQRCTVITLALDAENAPGHRRQVGAVAHDRCVAERRVDLGGIGFEHQQCQAGEPLSEQFAVALRESVRDERIAQARAAPAPTRVPGS